MAAGSPPTAPAPVSGPRPTLHDRLSTRDNALGVVRLVLAITVILGHAVPLGGFATMTWGPFAYSGFHGPAVDGFFAVSGYLILASGSRLRTLPYLWRRLLRIYPGFLVAIVVTAFVAAPLGALLEPGARWEAGSALHYVLGSLDLKPSQEGVRETLLAVPWPETWNGSLWTLFYEAAAYVGVAVLCALGPVRRRLRRIVPVAAVLLVVVHVTLPDGALAALLPEPVPTILGNGLRLWTFFACGMLAFVLGPHLRPRPVVAVLALLVVLTVLTTSVLPEPLSRVVYVPAMAVAVLWAGALLPWRAGNRRDLSYGIYIYAFPLQQLLVLLGITQAGYLVTALACVLCTLPVALASWVVVERPALRLAHRVPARGHPELAATSPSAVRGLSQQNRSGPPPTVL